MSDIFTSDITVKKFIKYVWPSIIMMVIIAIKYNMDSILVSNMLGETALAALSMAYPVQGVMWGVSVMLAAGSSAIVAIKMGEGKQQEANEKYTSICVLSVIIGTIFLLGTLLLLDPFVNLLGAEGELKIMVEEFLRIFAWSFPGAFLGLIFEYFIRVDGSPGFTLVLYLADALTHLVSALVLVGPFNMGMAGVAWANLIGLYVLLLVGIGYFIFKDTKLKLCKFSPDWKFIGHCFANGSSEMVTESSGGITTFCFNVVVIKLAGATGVAAVSITTNLHYFIVSVFLGYIMGISPLISYFYGAKEYDKVNQIIRYSKKFIVVTGVAAAIVCLAFAPVLVQMFERPGSELYEMAVTGVRCLAVAVLIGGVNIFASGFFTAYGNGIISAIISAGRALVFLVTGIFILSWLFGMTGIWFVITFADVLTLGLSFFMFKKYKDVYHYNL